MFNKEEFEKVYKMVAEAHAKNGHGPSDGIVCLHASLKYIGSLKEAPKGTSEFLAALYKSAAEAKSLSGFCSNASAAAKACGLGGGAKSQGFAEF